MHRIDTSTAQKDKFGAGKNGFTIGDAQTGVPPTEVSEDILDAIQEEICAVVEGGGFSLDKKNNSQLLAAIKRLASSRYFSAGDPLPTSNIGPIWHDDYASWMTWQTFNKNGADYTGYASQLIGSMLLDTQPTPRQGYIKSGVQNLSRTTYAPLRAWAQHNGIMVAPGVWEAGAIKCADNSDGITFRIYDVRGEFMRAWDDGRGVDSGRTVGSPQAATAVESFGLVDAGGGVYKLVTRPAGTVVLGSANYYTSDYDVREPIAASSAAYPSVSMAAYGSTQGTMFRVRPRNTALLAAIKF